jgi:signal transduction histidine kinase
MQVVPEAGRPDLWLVCPGSAALPGEARAVVEALEWTVAPLPPEAREQALRGEQPVLLWAPESWDAALSAVHQLPSRLRSRAVLACGAPAPAELGHRVRTAGALTYWRAPWQGWILQLARAALERDVVEPGAAVIRSLRAQAVERPEAFLFGLGLIAQTLLDADEMEAVVRTHSGELRALQAREDGVGSGPRFVDGAQTPPLEIAEKTLEWDQVVLVPDLRHAASIRGGDAWGAALGLPVHRERDGTTRTPEAVLALYWREPRLPTPREIGLARILAVAAEASWARLVERDRLTRTHIESLQALARLPWARSTIAGEATVEQDEVALFIRRSLLARSGLPQLTAFYVNPKTSSRGRGAWSRIAPRGDESLARGAEVQALRAAAELGHDTLLAHDDRTWHVVDLRAGAGGRSLGSLIAEYPDEAAARAARADLNGLAADLGVGLRLLRRSSDNAALVELSQLLSEARTPRKTLDRMAELLRRQLSADGIKVFVLAEATHTSRIEQLYRTDQPTQSTRSTVLDTKRGLSDWVVLQGDWICVRHPQPQEGRPLPSAHGVSGAHGEVELQPRAEQEYWEGDVADAERAQLMVPLVHRGQVAGVLGAWRVEDDAFDPVLDVETMQAFAPHVASACARVKTMERTQSELQAITRLAQNLQPMLSLQQADQLVLDEALRLSGGHLAVFLRYDTDRPGTLGVSALRGDGATSARVRTDFKGAVVAWGPEPESWGRQAAAWVAGGDAAQPVERRLAHHVVLPGGPDGQPLGLVLVVFRLDRPMRVPLIADTATWRAVDAFLHYAGVLLSNHVGIHSSALIDAVSRHDDQRRDPVERVADQLRRSIWDVVVVVSSGGGNRQTVTWTGPGAEALRGASVDTGALARGDHHAVVREADLEATESRTRRAFDPQFIERLKEVTGWGRVRSWMGVPIVHGNHLIGLVQVLTPAQGTVLGPDHARVAQALATWAAEEVLKAQRQQMLEGLNGIANRLAGAPPRELEGALGVALQGWARDYLHRAVFAVVIARSGPDHELLMSAGSRLPEAERTALHGLSQIHRGEVFQWTKAGRGAAPANPVAGRLSGVACPLGLAGGSSLEGHLVVLHARPFDEQDQAIVAEAAREMSVLLHGEVVRHEWKLQAGLFRHALLGPVQGLQSASLFLIDIVDDDEATPEELREARDRIALESETLRLWRETQRIYTMVQDGKTPDIRRRTVQLRPLVERCMARYRSGLAARNIELVLDWPIRGGLQVEVDRTALDLILSNLLDNARKYTHYNRSVVVGVEVGHDDIHLWVENVGREIPAELGDEIYEAGTRREGRDPVRAIAGEGLGLYLARALARAHGGELEHECEALSSRRDDKTPFRVRFTLRVPHHWSRGPRRTG